MISLDLGAGPRFTKPELLLHPSIPPKLHGVNPRTIRGEEWWDATRKAAYAANNYHCEACGVHQLDAEYKQVLEAHECYEYDVSTYTAKMVSVVALCLSCHQFIHWGRLSKVKGRTYLKKIILRGLDILYLAGQPLPVERLSAARSLLCINPMKYRGRAVCEPPFTVSEYLSTKWHLEIEEV